jgi:hypothetical protein
MGLTCLGPSPYPMYPNVPIEKHPRHCQWVTTIISSIISSSTYIVTHISCIYIYNYIYGICPFICGFYIFKFFLVISIYICVCVYMDSRCLGCIHAGAATRSHLPGGLGMFPGELLPGAEHGAPQLSQRHRRVAKKKGIEMRMSQSFWAYGTTDFRICLVLIILVGGLEDGFYFSICWE